MKTIIMIGSFFLLSNCSKNINQTKIGCVENEDFKKEFFFKIEYIEKNISVRQDTIFRNSLSFLSKYTKVSFESLANYARIYPIGIFEEDKKNWLKWYEDNKCNDIQFKP